MARPRGAWWTPEQARAAVAARQQAAEDTDYARFRARACLPPTGPFETAGTSPDVTDSHSAEHSPLPELGITPDQMTMEQYAAWRQQNQLGGHAEGRGIFDSASREAIVAGAARNAGRTAWSVSNVQSAPQLTGRYLRQDEFDTRPAAARFSTPGNAYSN